ncbi:MAG: type II secretion system protein [Planctomycetota bacterium]
MKKESGMTLMEVMIAAAIFTVMMSGIMYILLSGQDMFNQGSAQSVVETEGLRLLDRVSSDLPECKIITAPITNNNHAILTIQIPVISGTSYWSSTGTIYWGADGNQDWTITYQFETDSTNTRDEIVTQKDYNRDNDINDKFAIGKMVRIIKNGAGAEQSRTTLCANIIVNWNNTSLSPYTPSAVYYGFDLDVNSNGASDPLFQRLNYLGNEDSINGTRVKLNFYLSKLGAKNEPIFINVASEEKLINPQS